MRSIEQKALFMTLTAAAIIGMSAAAVPAFAEGADGDRSARRQERKEYMQKLRVENPEEFERLKAKKREFKKAKHGGHVNGKGACAAGHEHS